MFTTSIQTLKPRYLDYSELPAPISPHPHVKHANPLTRASPVDHATRSGQLVGLGTPLLLERGEWTPDSVRCGLVGTKVGMTAMWNEWGARVPVTIIQFQDVQVTHIIKPCHDLAPYRLQVGCKDVDPLRVNRPLLGHFASAGINPKAKLFEFAVTQDALLPIGTVLSASHFIPGQFVDITGISRGKGFAGAMKRWGFKGGPASHGTSLFHRGLGSTGQNSKPGRVFKGKKMAGNMGNDQVTVQNLQVLKIDRHLNCIWVNGCVPGPTKGYLRIKDAVRKYGARKFPKNGASPPFPTFIPEPEVEYPRELVANVMYKDPFAVRD
ncbi:hypothetical protein H4R35_002993 [Dimargaris xerosporica]|nr:hypothetical protein H4R35_002993 [Dimargaris xerosporica]